MAILPKAIYRLNAIPIKIAMTFSTELEQIILKFIGNHRNPKLTKSWEQRTTRSYNSSRLQNILQSYSNQNSMVLAQTQSYRSVKQNREYRNRSHTYGQLIYDKGGKTISIQWRKDSLLNKWCWENCTVTCKIRRLEHSLTPYTKINSKLFKYLNVRPERVKLLEMNIGGTLWHKSQQYFIGSVS